MRSRRSRGATGADGTEGARIGRRRLRGARTALAAATLAAALASGCTTGDLSAPGQGRTAGALRFHPCGGPFRCATLRVPVSYSDPGDGSIPLAVVELPATGPRRPVGDLVLDPGGPGASGVRFLEAAWTQFPASLRERFTLVAFDPRGAGASDPVVCASGPALRRLLALPPAPTTPAQVREVVVATRAFVAGCLRHTPRVVLAHLSTLEEARDLDRLRAALGERRLTYMGFSYGTYLGTLYLELYSRRVRAMVLDGAVDPALSTTEEELQQAEGFEQDLRDFFSWCPTDPACRAALPAGAEASYRALIARLEAGATVPAPLPARDGGPWRVDLGVAETAVVAGLYATADWPVLAEALGDALRGSGSLLALLALSYAGLERSGAYSDIVSADVAISCLDRPAPRSLGAYEALAALFSRLAPDFGAAEAWGSLPCAYWPVPPVGRPSPARDPGAPPVLVVGSTRDPATPYAWAEALAGQLQRAVLLTRAGDGHTAYFASACVRRLVDRYLVDLALPARGTVCPGGP